MTSHALNELSLYEAANGIRRGDFTAVELASACIERIDQRESSVHAFESFDADQVMKKAHLLDAEEHAGLLHGIPIGIKDIIDTVEYPSRCGSPIHADRWPRVDASCVALCRAAGALVFGKMVTTEFAYSYPGKTRNPHNLEHTPGGSSMGSAAAVADHMLPFAFGTQTAASVTRPAAYCGVIGYKASYGSFDLQGVSGLAASLDTLGFITRDLRDIPLMRSVLCGDVSSFDTRPDDAGPRIGFIRTPHWQQADLATKQLLESTAEYLSREGARVDEPALPPEFDDLYEMHRTIMSFESARARAHEYFAHPSMLSKPFIDLIEDGLAIDRKTYLNAQAAVFSAQVKLNDLFDQYDALLAPSAPSEAPLGLVATGDPVFSRMWAALRVPSVTLPAGVGEQGLPLGVQIVGRFNRDNEMLSIADWVYRRLP